MVGLGLGKYCSYACRVYSGTTVCYWNYMQVKIRDLTGFLIGMLSLFAGRFSLLASHAYFLSFFFLSECEAHGGWQVVDTEDVCFLS